MIALGNARTCGVVEPKISRWARLTCAWLALVASLAVLAGSAVPCAGDLVSLHRGQTVPGSLPASLLVVAAVLLVALCVAFLRQSPAARHSVWAVPVCFLGFVALGFNSAKLRPAALSQKPLVTAALLGAVLLLTQISARLARANACSCE